jgi:hypothetical protein
MKRTTFTTRRIQITSTTKESMKRTGEIVAVDDLESVCNKCDRHFMTSPPFLLFPVIPSTHLFTSHYLTVRHSTCIPWITRHSFLYLRSFRPGPISDVINIYTATSVPYIKAVTAVSLSLVNLLLKPVILPHPHVSELVHSRFRHNYYDAELMLRRLVV